ncbi:hypothetical protein NDU88_004846, partial [Pleurodeles waltl]
TGKVVHHKDPTHDALMHTQEPLPHLSICTHPLTVKPGFLPHPSSPTPLCIWLGALVLRRPPSPDVHSSPPPDAILRSWEWPRPSSSLQCRFWPPSRPPPQMSAVLCWNPPHQALPGEAAAEPLQLPPVELSKSLRVPPSNNRLYGSKSIPYERSQRWGLHNK